jgi:hypothetical protein
MALCANSSVLVSCRYFALVVGLVMTPTFATNSASRSAYNEASVWSRGCKPNVSQA